MVITSRLLLLKKQAAYLDYLVTFQRARPLFSGQFWTRANKRYHSVGNYPKLTANPVDKTLSVSVKASAVAYQTMKYFWNGDKLVPRK